MLGSLCSLCPHCKYKCDVPEYQRSPYEKFSESFFCEKDPIRDFSIPIQECKHYSLTWPSFNEYDIYARTDSKLK